MQDREHFRRLRLAMVETLISRGIRDWRVLSAMRVVPRHRFVPAAIVDNSYEDRALPIGLDQTISQPFVVAFMSESLELTGTERVLEIGTGCGYQTAILAELAGEVFSVEILPELAQSARATLQTLCYRNVRLRTGDGNEGWPEEAPFDRILIAAAPARIPDHLGIQLDTEGSMIVPVGEALQELLLCRRDGAGLDCRSLLPVQFVPMTGGQRLGGGVS